MRRKIRYGVASNRTIKKGCCVEYCGVCKGLCKNNPNIKSDPESNWHLAKEPYEKKKIQNKGFGSLMPGKKFVYCLKYCRGEKRATNYNMINKKQELKELNRESLAEYDKYFSYN